MSLGKKDIVNNIYTKAQLPKIISQEFLSAFLNFIINNKTKSVVKISNFGTFYKHKSPERIGRNPKTGKEYLIPETIKIKFRASNIVKNTLN